MSIKTVQNKGLGHWYRQGTPWIWLNAGALTISLMAVIGLLGYIFLKGIVHFWPHPIMEAQYVQEDGTRELIAGEIADSEYVTSTRLREAGEFVPGEAIETNRKLIKVGNRDIGGRSIAGSIFYAAMYRAPLSEAEIAQNVAELLRTDDR